MSIYKRISTALIFTIIASLFSYTVVFEKTDGMKIGTAYDSVELHLDPELQASTDGAIAYQTDKTFISNEFQGEFEFNAVSLEWEELVPDATSINFYIKFLESETGDWTDWITLDKESDDGTTSYSFAVTNPATAFQYKVVMHSDDSAQTPYLKDMSFQYVDTSNVNEDEEGLQSQAPSAPLEKVKFTDTSLDIISRSEWGADESYRFYTGDESELDEDDGKSSTIEQELWGGAYNDELEIADTVSYEDGERLAWAQEYPEDITKIIIHHTATTSDLDDPEAAIRAIYYYHAISRGWGDVGYNYIIDQYGNIYEGRAGGEGVVGGHSAGFNVGSIGISILGNYEESELSYDALVSLMALIQDQAEEFDIDVEGSSQFRDRVLANVSGHRDSDATACPGENVYKLLPYIRSSVASATSDYSYDSTTTEFAYEAIEDWETISMDPEDEQEFTFKLKNIGTETWDDKTYLVANTDYDADLIVNLNKDATKSIAYLNESSVAPGSTGSFTVKLNSNIQGGFVSFDITPLFNGYKKTSNYMNLPVYVEAPDLSYEVTDIDVASERIESGHEVAVSISIKNNGNITWTNDGDYPLYLGVPDGGESDLISGLDKTKYGLMSESSVEPGETASFDFNIKGPTASGYYTAYFTPVFGDVTEAEPTDDSYFEILAYDKSDKAEFVSKSDKTEFEPGEKEEVWIELENIGYETWTDDNISVGFLKYIGITISNYYLAESSVEPGETGKIKFTLSAPGEEGDYKILIKPRMNGSNLVQKYFYYEFSVVDNDESNYDEPDVRVRLSIDENEPVITADSGFDMYSDDKLLRSFDGGDDVTVSFDGTNYKITSGGFAWVTDSYPVFTPQISSTIMEIDNFENIPSWNTSLNDNKYRGSLEVRDVDGEMAVINELPLESYVKGVAEVSNSDPTEK
ncbi:MAG: N-acetylmuramoyl-L-alanine amidase, partial [Candidatus Gracilibacteria bacterium]